MHQPIRGLLLLLGCLIFNSWPTMAEEPGTDSRQTVDPALSRFVQTVVETNPRVLAARAAVEASEAYKAAAGRPLYNPELSLDAENASSDTRSVGISQTIDWRGKRSARTAVAESEWLAVEAEYLAVRWAITVELLGGLVSYQTGTERNALAGERARLMNEFTTLADLRFQAGDLNQVESDLAAIASTQARMQKAAAAAELAEARAVVRSLVPGSSPEQWPALSDQLPGLPGMVKESEELILALPEVRAAQRRVDAASAVVELRQRQRRADPTVSLAGGREDDDSLIGVTVSIPLNIRNRFKHEVTAAVAERSQARLIADDILRRAHARFVSALERYQLSEQAWRDWERTGLVSVNRQIVQLQRLWKTGEISTTDYLVQLRQTLDVQESALELRQGLWSAWFEWLTAAGQVDVWLNQGATQ